MKTYMQFLAMLPVLVVCYQLYSYSDTSKGVDRQRRCQKLGIVYMTLGTTALISREYAFAVLGMMLIMMGFRLMAKGLDRLEKNIFIDRYDGPNNGSEPKKKEKGD